VNIPNTIIRTVDRIYGEDKVMSISEKSIEYGSDKAAKKQKALRGSGNADENFQKMAENVYAHLNDEISKKIFEARRLFAATGDLGDHRKGTS